MANSINLFGLRGIVTDYRIEYLFKSMIYPVSISICLSLVFLYYNVDTLNIIKLTSSQVTDIVPDLIGFLLGGYALLIGFGNHDILRLIAKADPKDNLSVYQTLNAVFSVSLLSQFIVLLFAIIVNYITSSNIGSIFDEKGTTYFNNIFSFVFMTMIFWSVWNIKDMVINIFNFGQIQFLDIKRKEKCKGQNK